VTNEDEKWLEVARDMFVTDSDVVTQIIFQAHKIQLTSNQACLHTKHELKLNTAIERNQAC